jgi:hypothetical protein
VVAVLFAICAYTFALRHPAIGWGAGALIVAGAGAALIARAPGGLGHAGRWLTAGLIVTAALLFPVHESWQLVRAKANDSLGLAVAPDTDIAALSQYLQPRTRGTYYEVAVDEPLGLAPLLIRDRRPILPLTSFGGRPLTSLAALQSAVQAGQVRYGLVGRFHCGPRNAGWAACSPAARWIRAHGVNVSAQAGITGSSRLYWLPASAGAGP